MSNPARLKRTQRPVREAKQARARATVDVLLEAAARVLVSQGWDRLTTNRVAEVAGVSIGSLYEYFRDKTALIDALHDRHLARGEALLAKVAGDRPPRDNASLAAMLVEGFVALHGDDPRLHRVLSLGVPISAAVRQRIDLLHDAALGLVAAGLSDRVADPAVVARLLVDAADALTHRWIIEPGGKPVKPAQMAGELTRMLTAYLDASPKLAD